MYSLVLIGFLMANSGHTTNPFYPRLTPQGRILDLSKEGYIVWSCSPIRDDAGKVHVFFTRVPAGGEGWFKNFRTQGHIVHAIGENPEGPYTVKDVVVKGRGEGFWDAFGVVNPRIYRVGRQYALFYTAYETPWPRAEMKEHIGLLLSDDLRTWRRAHEGAPILSPSDDPHAWDHQLVNNASFVKHPRTGEYLLYYRGIQTLKDVRDCIGVAMATNIEGPWRKFEKNPVINPDKLPSPGGKRYRGFEDPCIWIEDGRFCMLAKDMGYFRSPTSAFFQSSDGIHWGLPARGYNTPDDSPQLLFNAEGRPEFLFVNRHRRGGPFTGFVFRINREDVKEEKPNKTLDTDR
jgi:predicted GH43/DUF377 family glycosyl hydrolase